MSYKMNARWAAGTFVVLFLLFVVGGGLVGHFFGSFLANITWAVTIGLIFFWSVQKGGWLHKKLWIS